MRNNNYKYALSYFSFTNRWLQKKHRRNADWLIIGVSKWWCSPALFCYKISLFGLEVRIWINRIFK